jgi:hypothetical protein
MTSIREQILTRKIEVSHAGKSVTYTLPTYLSGITPEVLDNENLLVEYMNDKGCLHGLLHVGLQQEIINVRAIPRKKTVDGQPIAQTAENITKYQKMIDSYKPALMPNPAASKAGKEPTPEKALEILLKGMTAEQLMERLMAMTAK